jgi:uncharacterized integral membrane protein
MKFALIVAMILTALIATFALQNSQSVQVQFLGWYFEGALVFVLLLTFAIGLLTMYFAALPGQFRRRREITQLKKELEKFRRETKRLATEGKPSISDEK